MKYTGLKDKRGQKITIGSVVHWSDGGEELDMEQRIRERWDRIAVVGQQGILPHFSVIDSPDAKTKAEAHTFCYGSFIYRDTENPLTVVADSIEDYKRKFSNAGECMRWVAEHTKDPFPMSPKQDQRNEEMTDRSDELLPCPHCGSQPFRGRTGDGQYTAKCYHCSTVMKQNRADKLAGMWNARSV